MSGPCTRWDAAAGKHCGGTPTRPYITGPRCQTCTPAALAGQPEPDQSAHCAPARCYCRNCPSWTEHNPYATNADSWVTDARNIASGRKRASATQQASAKQTVAEQKAREQQLRRRA
jgi:hypothetical protein